MRFLCAARVLAKLGRLCNVQTVAQCGAAHGIGCKAFVYAALRYGAAHIIGGAARVIGTNLLKNGVFSYRLPCLRHGLAGFHASRIIRA
jgi:hypothetical protein